MRSTIWAMAFILGACNGADPDDTHSHGDDDDGQDEGLDALPDLFETLEGRSHACEDQPEYNPEVATATTYFIGEFTMDAEGVISGKEYWVLGANPYWQERGGHDCTVVWNVGGNVGDAVMKGHYSLSISANVDAGASDCPQDASGNQVYVGYESFNVTYDVYEHPDGTAEFSYAETGNYLGEGHYNGSAVTYISDMNCKMF